MPIDKIDKEKHMSLIEHLDELRGYLIRGLIALVIATIASLFFSRYFFFILQNPLFEASSILKLTETGKSILRTLSPTEIVVICLKISILGGIIISSPYILYQIWLFTLPALKENEKKALIRALFLGSVFFILGLIFCYFIVLKWAFIFFIKFNLLWKVKVEWSVENYYDFILKLLIIFGAIFEYPVIIWLLSRFNLVKKKFLKEKRKYAIILIFILAAIFTPPDVITQMLLAIPMILLYEIGIWFCKK